MVRVKSTFSPALFFTFILIQQSGGDDVLSLVVGSVVNAEVSLTVGVAGSVVVNARVSVLLLVQLL